MRWSLVLNKSTEAYRETEIDLELEKTKSGCGCGGEKQTFCQTLGFHLENQRKRPLDSVGFVHVVGGYDDARLSAGLHACALEDPAKEGAVA